MTVFVAKGLQFPIVYLPFAFNRYVRTDDVLLYHDEAETRCLYIGGKRRVRTPRVEELNRQEAARDNIRLTYVALTRAQSQVVAWWAPSSDEVNGGLSRLLRGAASATPKCPTGAGRAISDEDAWAVFSAWQYAGGPVVEDSVVAAARCVQSLRREPIWGSGTSTARSTPPGGGHRIRGWSAARTSAWPASRRSDAPRRRDRRQSPSQTRCGRRRASPMAAMPAGAPSVRWCTRCWRRPTRAADLAAELRNRSGHSAWWPVDVDPPSWRQRWFRCTTRRWAAGRRADLRQIGLRDRLRELDFEIPLAGGDVRDARRIALSDVGELLRSHLPADDPVAPYADRLIRGGWEGSRCAGICRVDRRRPAVPGSAIWWWTTRPTTWATPRRITAVRGCRGDAAFGLSAAGVAVYRCAAPVSALAPTRLRPGTHLGGVLYLFVRGMCGVDTPMIDGQPCGVFSWSPPAELVVALSDLLDEGRRAA